MKYLMKWTTTLCVAGLMTACGGDTHTFGNIADEARGKGYTALLAAATKANLVGALTDANANLTVFAPTDAAFNALATQLGFANAGAMVTALTPAQLTSILQYHLLPGIKNESALRNGGATQSTAYTFPASGTTKATLSLNTSSGVKLTDAALTLATVTSANLNASNGIIHQVDKVLVPPGVLNLLQTAQVNPGTFSALGAAVGKAGTGVVDALTSGSKTLFAPTNTAFTSLATQLGFTDAGALVTALSASDLTKILQYHLLPTAKNAATLSTGPAAQSTAYTFEASAATSTISTTGGVKITDAALTQATVAAADVNTVNGIIHVVDKVLVPPGVLNVVQMAQVNPATFSTLVSSVVSANLKDTLSGAGPFTLFAPTNAAFTAAAPTVAGLTATQLPFVLKYHVLGSQVLSTSIPFGTAVATLNTNNLNGAVLATGQTITINNNPLAITDKTAVPAPITATDVRASNGVIHVVSKVLIPN